MRTVGVISGGIRTPIIREGDDLATIVTESVVAASEEAGFTFRDRDIVAVTESVVARSAGNYCGVQDIAADIQKKFSCDHLGTWRYIMPYSCSVDEFRTGGCSRMDNHCISSLFKLCLDQKGYFSRYADQKAFKYKICGSVYNRSARDFSYF